MGNIQTQQTGAQGVKRTPQAGAGNRDAQVKRFLAEAMKYQGQPYLAGGGHSAQPGRTGPVDCTGLVIQAALKAGVKIPPQSGEGYDAWSDAVWSHWGKYRSVSRDELKPGDICYFNNGEHVGIYMGKDPKTNEDILLNAECTNGVYARRNPWGLFGKFDGAVRLIPDDQPAGPAVPRRDFPGHERRVSFKGMEPRPGGGGVGGVKTDAPAPPGDRWLGSLAYAALY